MTFRLGRLRVEMPRDIAEYTSSLKFDQEIYREVIVINAVHLKMLARLGHLSGDTLARGLSALREAYGNPLEKGDPRLEDVHMVVEDYLVKAVPEAGENLALGKSRNDSVATAIRMRAKSGALALMESAIVLVEALLVRGVRDAETVYPATTHHQTAAPATFGFALTHYASRILSALNSLVRAYEELDQCPQGAVACSGSTLPIDREWLAEQLGFKRVLAHALDASSSRDFAVDILSAALKLLIVVSDMAEWLIHDFTQGLLDMGDEFCSTSSIMPQKRNPVLLEVARTKASEALGEVVRVASMIQRRAGGYVLDLQQATPSIWRLLREAESTVRVLSTLVGTLRVDAEAALRRCGMEAGMVELANYLTLKYGIGFRRAHKACGKIARILAEKGLTEEALLRVCEEEGIPAKLTIGEVSEILDPRRIVSNYATLGSANPSEVKRMVEEMGRRVMELRAWVSENRRMLEAVVERAFNAQAL
ncbi:Argininosuccinate lyase [Candidatus Calditenuaceae archaeon HR02]|nr:Argininosuccinate lyase [Candidatus Calditenuaceae archaeon HR02]